MRSLSFLSRFALHERLCEHVSHAEESLCDV